MHNPIRLPVSPSLMSALPATVRCPLCGARLTVDPCWASPHWICETGHSYSNPRVLLAELRERGLVASEATGEAAGARSMHRVKVAG
jgi:hypothetical protein